MDLLHKLSFSCSGVRLLPVCWQNPPRRHNLVSPWFNVLKGRTHTECRIWRVLFSFRSLQSFCYRCHEWDQDAATTESSQISANRGRRRGYSVDPFISP